MLICRSGSRPLLSLDARPPLQSKYSPCLPSSSLLWSSSRPPPPAPKGFVPRVWCRSRVFSSGLVLRGPTTCYAVPCVQGKLLSRLLDTAKGMAYLHSKGIMHGDLKACNVLLQNLHGEGDQVAKISDFGLATVLLNGATHRSTASMGTITHMAPEVLRSGHVSCAADVYSFAILCKCWGVGYLVGT